MCIKIYNLLTKYCNVSVNEAQKLSMTLESQIRAKYPEMKEEYIKFSMTLLRNIKVKIIIKIVFSFKMT